MNKVMPQETTSSQYDDLQL